MISLARRIPLLVAASILMLSFMPAAAAVGVHSRELVATPIAAPGFELPIQFCFPPTPVADMCVFGFARVGGVVDPEGESRYRVDSEVSTQAIGHRGLSIGFLMEKPPKPPGGVGPGGTPTIGQVNQYGRAVGEWATTGVHVHAIGG